MNTKYGPDWRKAEVLNLCNVILISLTNRVLHKHLSVGELI